MKSRQRFRYPFFAISAIYVLSRLVYINAAVTTDEPFWLGRSANFYRALVEGDFVHTYQMAHPGVMTMWAGAIAYLIAFPGYASHAAGNLDNVYSIEQVLRGMGQDPLRILVATKICKILLQTVIFSISLVYLRRLTDLRITVATGLLIAIAPFTSGYDAILHVDGLFSILAFAAILAVVDAAEHERVSGGADWKRWAGAGVLAAMAWLTRSTGLVLIGVAGLTLLFPFTDHVHRVGMGQIGSAIRSSVVRGLVWLSTAMATTFLLLPALWVAPKSTLSKLWAWSSNAATEGHENPTFYRGIHHGNPGWSVYPEVLAWRTSVVEWAGIVTFLLLAWWGWRNHKVLDAKTARLLVIAAVYAVVYVAAMSLGAKKFDRYVLPAFPVIALFAGTGFVLLLSWIEHLRFPRAQMLSTGVACLLIIGQATAWAGALPYRLDYYNPILGGAQSAQHVLQMGWGQGGKQVVEFLEQQSDGHPVTVQTSAVTSAFTYFLHDDTTITFASFGLATPAGWYETDYYVAGIQQTQRDLAPAYLTLRNYEPVHTVEINGVPYFTVFDVRNLPLPAALLTPTACNYAFGTTATLMQIIGRDDSIDLYFLSGADDSTGPVTIDVVLTAPDGTQYYESADLPLTAEGTMTKASIGNPAGSAEVPLAEFDITLKLSQSGTNLPASATWSSESPGQATVHSECYYTTPPASS